MPNNLSQSPKKSSSPELEIAQLREEVARLSEQLATTERIYAHFVPQQILQFLAIDNIRDVSLGLQTERYMSVMFSDIRDFTSQSEHMSPQENFNFLNSFLSQMEPVIGLNHGFIDKYIGDAIMALFPETTDDSVLAALGMLERLNEYNTGRARAGYAPTHIGIGINTGIVMLGTIGGANRMEGTVISDAVNVASRLEGLTKLYGASLLISEHTLHSLEHPERFMVRFIDRVCVKGKHEPQSLYEVFDSDPQPLREAKQRTHRIFEEALAYYHLRDVPRARTRLMQCLDDAPGDLPARMYLERCDEYLRSGRYAGDLDSSLAQAWSDDFSVGDAEDDNQRRALLMQMAHLAAAVRDGHAAEIEPTLHHIEANTTTHFAAQEKIMRATVYPFLDDHVRHHQRFIQSFGKLKARIESRTDDPVHLAFDIKLKFCDWLINHSLKFDRHFYHYKRQHDLG